MSGEHADGCALAGAVGTEQSVDLAGTDAQVEGVDGGAAGEVAAEAPGADGVAVGRRLGGRGRGGKHDANLPIDR
ncbi:hypothetical protein SFR_2529 [Streptomyces sp. FR-008]|nr:hypothetical protein SFR_2529 [Streptomyces sp. FR-008]